MKKTNILNLLVIVAVIISAMLAIAAPALAAGRCAFVEGHGWHIVGGGELNDHWYETQTECEIALQVPTVLATLQATNLPTDVPTYVPTDIPSEEPTNVPTDLPTDIPTESPTEPPVVTETPLPTDLPTDLPTVDPTMVPTDHGPFPTEVVPTWTPNPVTPVPSSMRRGITCQRAWDKITNTIYEREVGFRFFENPNHSYCEAWLLKTHGIVWDVYKVMYPLEN